MVNQQTENRSNMPQAKNSNCQYETVEVLSNCLGNLIFNKIVSNNEIEPIKSSGFPITDSYSLD